MNIQDEMKKMFKRVAAGEAMAVLYYNAELFAGTKQIEDTEARRKAIRETYEEVCRFMRYYHKPAKPTERASHAVLGQD